MEGQAYFTTLAGLAVSLAGFGAVIAWLRDDPARWDPVDLWRLRTIVRHGLTTAFLCLVLIPIHEFVGEAANTVRLGSVLIVVLIAAELVKIRDPDPAVWSPRSSLHRFIAVNGAILVVALINVVWASLALLQILILFLLTSPAGIFSRFVRALGSSDGRGPQDHSAPGS